MAKKNNKSHDGLANWLIAIATLISSIANLIMALKK